MAIVTARIKVKGKHYEVRVNLDEALKIREGKGGNILSALESPNIFTDIDKGTIAPSKDLMDAFALTDAYEIAKIIITKGEVQKTQEFREAAKEAKIKQVLSLIVKNASDQNGRPYTEERIKRAIEEIHFNFDARPAEQQISEVIHKLKSVIPIKIETKRIKIRIPAQYTAQVYGLVKDHKESEEWLSNGDLEVIMDIPSGLQIEFYDKLNSATHGSIQSEELKKEE